MNEQYGYNPQTPYNNQTIPENYGQVAGDDSVTQFLPGSQPVFQNGSRQLTQPYFTAAPATPNFVNQQNKPANTNLIVGITIGVTSIVALIIGLIIIL